MVARVQCWLRTPRVRSACALAGVAIGCGVVLPWCWQTTALFRADTPPWWLFGFLSLGIAGTAWWWICAGDDVAPHDEQSATTLLPEHSLRILQRVADVMPCAVLIANAQLQLCAVNDCARQDLHGAASASQHHIVDVAARLPWGSPLLALLDRLMISPHHSVYQQGLTIVKLATTTHCHGYWIMHDGHSATPT